MVIEFVPTGNEWDAPVFVEATPEGTVRVTRCEPEIVLPKHVHRWASIEHAVVSIDGELSEFDQLRQPRQAAWAPSTPHVTRKG